MLKNPLFKLFFIEKCALFPSSGQYIITRLRPPISDSKLAQKVIINLHNALAKVPFSNNDEDVVFWFISNNSIYSPDCDPPSS